MAKNVKRLTMGNGVSQAFTWNDRGQPTNLQITNATNGPSNPLLNFGFSPCPNGATACPTLTSTGNNGNLHSQTIQAPGFGPVTQTYTYDAMNRLTAASEAAWSQTYGYDVKGNRWVASTSSNLPQPTLETPTSASWYTSANRITGWSYDAGGNLLQVGGMMRSFTYEAENRQVSATINTTTSNYTFDGLGQRVTKTVGTGPTTVYVYDAFGNLAAEYTSQVSTSPCGTPTCYVSWDHLGSMRMLTDANGSSTVKRYDYLPFGGELLAGIGGRTAAMGYFSTPDATNPKFTGQMRDPETYDPNGGTAVDWFIARAFSGAQGRFQSVDPENAGADPSNPQTWNAYAYVGNNPLSYTDPSGMISLGGLFQDIAGGFFGLLAGLVTGNPYIGIAAGYTVANGGVPGFTGGPSASISTLGGCGGPLGNCGTLGSDPWSENSGLGDVQDPGRFVSNYCPGGGCVDSSLLSIQLGLSQLPIGTPARFYGPFLQGLFGAHQRLQSGKCSAFFGGRGEATLNSSDYRFVPFNPSAAAQTVPGTTSVQINTNGAYMGNSPVQGYAKRDWTMTNFRSMILLHELGHELSSVTGFKPDTAMKAFNEGQSFRMASACF